MKVDVCALLSAAGLALASAAAANDSTFGGAGADLVPLAQGDVAMQSEDIVLTYRDDAWQVQARYVFLNHAAEPVTLQVGFPEYRCELDPNADCHNVAFRDLTTRVDGKPVKHRSGTLSKKHAWASYLGTVWLFDATFPAARELVIEHSYSLSSGGDVMGNKYTTYVTRTGASWKGSIGRARFTARLPAHTHTVDQLPVAGAQIIAPRLLLDAEPRVELVIEAKDWTPRGEVHVAFNASSDLARARSPAARAAWHKGKVAHDELFRSSECWSADSRTPEAARDCKNLVYASKGYGFKSRALGERYYGNSADFQLVKTDLHDSSYWVRGLTALPRFSVEDFTASERELLARLERVGKAEPAASAAPLAFSPPSESSAAPSASLASEPPRARPVGPPPRKACDCRAVGARAGSAGLEATALLLLGLLGARRGRRAPKPAAP